ncbi:sigma factor-like helix-turn-helix DNA-binding protein [Promicromonospora citrea]|uniref:HTH luxR-type domain-containing protein n=1 Tax=Promicromonospora citrea TaxID=43677 RepID=A0A8H9L3P1_9MICO|nr:sigma factor-like helix-turn-helix DNA-binding protein [Promicromonospora citrea]NNH52776.1 HTH domain-containing protein [Promicromonospora citrea]GGM29600.1 hypothetical protein GCM10010102_26470 [Promicromonospora citrea]
MRVETGTGTTAGAPGAPNTDFSAFVKPSTFPWAQTQRVVDAVARLEIERSRVARAVELNQPVAARLIGRGPAEINGALAEAAGSWRMLESICRTGSVEQLRVSLPNNAYFMERGMRMISIWNRSGLDADARLMLSGEDPSVYYFAFAPLQMKIIDGVSVLLEGPVVQGQRTVMDVRDTACLTAARAYWDAVVDTMYPCEAETAVLTELTPRQRRIVTLMLTSSTDEEIADKLGLSVRTVRSDIATVLDLLDAPTRFVAGVRLRERLSIAGPHAGAPPA